MAHQIAMANPEHITADVIEATEFPELSRRYGVMAVPKIIINDVVQFEGAVPEEMFVEQVKRALEMQ
ncbi:MAG: hypothetical protein EXR50_00990 [Dehalococcoidia bacterium]|nr:hypothetical protein [Dehalococcoidia bacterium]